jgi:hypothetical protein
MKRLLSRDIRHEGRRPTYRGVMALLGVGLVLILTASTTLAITRSYAGWSANADKLGIRGYIQQPDSGSVPGESVASWVGLCGYSCTDHAYADGGSGFQWVQLGMYQGTFACCDSVSVVSQYRENVDPCGTYYSHDLTPPDQNRQWYSVRWDGHAAWPFNCPDGTRFLGYVFAYKKGSPSNDPFWYGVMATNDGRADTYTEYHDTPPQATTYFGCYSPGSCNDQAYGLEIQDQNGTWVSWQGAATSIQGPDNPPYRHTFNQYWSFKTCKTAAAC